MCENLTHATTPLPVTGRWKEPGLRVPSNGKRSRRLRFCSKANASRVCLPSSNDREYDFFTPWSRAEGHGSRAWMF